VLLLNLELDQLIVETFEVAVTQLGSRDPVDIAGAGVHACLELLDLPLEGGPLLLSICLLLL